MDLEKANLPDLTHLSSRLHALTSTFSCWYIGHSFQSVSGCYWLRMRKKPKRKDKGKTRYRHAHGNWYRVRLGYRLRRKIKQRKILRELNKQKTDEK